MEGWGGRNRKEREKEGKGREGGGEGRGGESTSVSMFTSRGGRSHIPTTQVLHSSLT